jgi:signal transduction histidine kinase
MWTTIVSNLVNNALKYTPAGEVSVSLNGDDSQVVLAVADTGVGIPLDEQAHIFERFHRVLDDQQPWFGDWSGPGRGYDRCPRRVCRGSERARQRQ